MVTGEAGAPAHGSAVEGQPPHPRPRADPAVGRALTNLPADLVLVSSYSTAGLVPLLPALGRDAVPPVVPLRHTAAVHYLRPDGPSCSPDAESELRWRTEEIASWAQTHDRPVVWVRAGNHHEREVRSAARSAWPSPVLVPRHGHLPPNRPPGARWRTRLAV